MDFLCEQFGLERIEQVGKKFTVCAGLKMNDSTLDHRLINSHHSVRVLDFALALQNYLKTYMLINNKKLFLKFGIN